ncbi:hypothetical protein DL95DRAFT_460419 [Leptodontidium sp. 2 PMI_412]|nr:hypothetical protein DL95DRAFT_460419 [Leptodontidium sp. 2 PMI_412]
MTTQLSVDQTLRLTQRELVQFVQQNITHEDGTWNVSNIVDWEDVSQAKRDLLAAKLLPAVQKTTEPSVNATDLAALSSTVESPENAIQEYETKCYQALLDDGCRPLFLISLLLQVSTNADAYYDLLRPWTRYPVVSKSDNPRTSRSKKHKLPTDENTREPQLKIETKVAGETDGPETRSRKRRKAIHKQHGSEDPSSVLELSLGITAVSVQVSSTVASNSRPRRQAKRISRGTVAELEIKGLRFTVGMYGIQAISILYRNGSASPYAGDPVNGWTSVMYGSNLKVLRILKDDLKCLRVDLNTVATSTSMSRVFWDKKDICPPGTLRVPAPNYGIEEDPTLLVTTSLHQTCTFGPCLEFTPVQDWQYTWTRLDDNPELEIEGIFFDALSLGRARRIANIGLATRRGKMIRPGKANVPRVPVALTRPRIGAEYTGLFFSVASLSQVQNLQVRRVGASCRGLAVYHYNGSVEILGQWDYYETSDIFEIYTRAEGALLCINFYSAGLTLASSFDEISVQAGPAEPLESRQCGQTRTFFVDQGIAWWFSRLYDHVEVWNGTY